MRLTTVKEEDFRSYVEAYSKCIIDREHIRWQVIVCWISPITKKFDSRSAYFSERAEADIYENFLCSTYDQYGFDYVIDTVYIGKDEE